MMRQYLLLLSIVVFLAELHVSGSYTYAAQCAQDKPCKQVGSSLYPISASASLGALGNVTLSQAGPEEPALINVTYDDTGSFLGAMGAFQVHIAAEPIDKVNAGMILDECRGAIKTMYDPDKHAPPHVQWRLYVANGCDGTGAPDQEETRAREKVCALGDLSGKHGSLPGPSGTRTIEDRSLSVHDVIGRAFVLVNEKSKSVACANIAMIIDDDVDFNNPQLVMEEEPPADTVRALNDEDLSRSTVGGIKTTQQCSTPMPKCTSGHQQFSAKGFVGSSIYPISASASLGALANVTLSQAGADEPVRINVTYDDTSSFQGAIGAFRVYIAAEPLDRIDAGVTVAECLTLPMYDPNEQAPPFVRLSVYVRRGCDGEADMMMMSEDDIPDHNDTQVAAREKSCALGDLSGKHGLLPAPKGTHTFEDRSITNLNDIIGLSFVMVNDESRTIACANIVMDVDDTRSEDVTLRIMSPEPIEATHGAYPWIVYMSVCSGTLIAPTVILTAAHCVSPYGPIRLGQAVYMGCTDVSNKACQESGRITGIFPHEKYQDASLPKYAYDVAVLILERPSRVPVATLATRDDDPAYCATSLSTVAGWGRSKTRRYSSDALLEVNLPVTSRERCEEAWGKGRIGPTMICAGFDDGRCDACKGDSGGPIFTSTQCAPPGTPPRVFGIVSWGSKCSDLNRKPYGVYTSVASVRDWIASKMLEGELADPDESVLPYVVRSIDETVETATDSTLCTLLDDQSRCGEDEVMKLCPKLCGGSCPLVQNVKRTTITPPQTTTSSSTTTTAPPPKSTTTSSSTTTTAPPQTTTTTSSSTTTTTSPPKSTTSSRTTTTTTTTTNQYTDYFGYMFRALGGR
ncbi:vitellin-degrading protease [Pycnococcus provasolii]